ncbi:FG-GAP-like repeat-containing protein [Sedimentitalea sp. JM2-8]|uniref:FG-GAP-like repeat-containing protein n=1 Tax=Sedimentitalea xiamensis TaxID=3050037 RepID=A0ABT7F9T7_9RHOB|nr:FG-GAP-like repeat-containing protein [Sedimentitalea xiamensis]MDK3071866.1 FG-GAP-like repeat-containing protein [Sedimentitalea xiamensis]
MLLAQGAAAQDGWATAPGTGIVAARYDADADVYPHRIMGRIREKHVLLAQDDAGQVHSVDLRQSGSSVFEDIAPRVVDADGDGVNDVVVVETDPRAGAQLAVYGLRRGGLTKIAATPHIGTRFRWLAPVAVADLDGDGTVDLAYVDRPHLAMTLQVWTWAGGGLTRIAEMGDLTNHRIGDEVIWGGLRDCGAGPEMVLADGGFNRIVLVRLTSNGLRRETTGLAATDGGFRRVLSCRY